MELRSKVEGVVGQFQNLHSPIGVALPGESQTLRGELRNVLWVDLVPVPVPLPSFRFLI